MFRFGSNQHPSAPDVTPVPLNLSNTLSGRLDVFEPLKDREVRMYNCGPTVYGYVHIGNLRSYVFADTLKRVLAYNGYRVRQVINLTDVGHLTGEHDGDTDAGEDKMRTALRQEGLELTLANMRALGERYADAFKADLAALHVDTTGTQFPRASDHIETQIALIQTLEEKGYAYTITDGVYFDTSRFPGYGKLGNVSVEGQHAGARVATNPEKRAPADFALWKFSPADDDSIGWASPWGRGFPGWHIECSAMAWELLGKQIDIHTGGIDHIGVHHNNEIAQTESITDKPLARYWLHNEFVSIEAKKIAKSVGNTVYLYHLTERGYSPLAYRYWLLTGHYASPMNFTWDALDGAQTAHRRLLRLFVEELGARTGAVHADYQQRFHTAINNDLDTPKALAILWELVKDGDIAAADKRATLLDFDRVLALGLGDAATQLKRESKRVDVADAADEVQRLLARREDARREGDFATADALREEIREHGFEVEDTSDGPNLTRREG